jgi:hypothetical protein
VGRKGGKKKKEEQGKQEEKNSIGMCQIMTF